MCFGKDLPCFPIVETDWLHGRYRNACLGAAGPLAPRCGAFGEDGEVFGASGGGQGGLPVVL